MVSNPGRSRALAVVFLLVASILTIGLGLPAGPPAGRAQEQPVTILQSIDTTSLDPYFHSTLPEFNINRGLFDVLIGFDEQGKLVPGLATEWRSVDPTTWELKIRQGVRAHDGEVVDATDIAYTFERALDSRVGARGVVPYILGTTQFASARAVDAQTLRITTKAPVPFFPSLIAEWTVLPQGFYSRSPLNETALRAVGTGPYKLVEWRRGERLVMEANEQYWGGAPQAKRVIFRPVPEASARVAELNTGAADIILNVSPDLRTQVDTRRAAVTTVQGLRRIYVGFVFYGHPAMKNKRVRQAINYGLDFQKIIDTVLLGNGKRVGTFVNAPNQNPDVKPYPYDPDRSRQLMTEAGYTDRNNDGFLDDASGARVKLRMVTPVGRYIKDVELSQAIAADLRRVGLDVEVVRLDWSVLAPTLPAGRVQGDMFFLGAGTGWNCLGDLTDFYSKSGWDPGRWANTQFDNMIVQLTQTFDERRQRDLCNQLQKHMHEEAPIVFLYFQVDYYGISNRIDWKPSPNERVYVNTIKFKR
jgi:peptide/nickel transport system substrate-binding protein